MVGFRVDLDSQTGSDPVPGGHSGLDQDPACLLCPQGCPGWCLVARYSVVGIGYIRGSWNHHGDIVKNDEKEIQNGQSMELQSLELMGIFLGLFGFIVAASAFIPDTWVGRIADLVVGGALMATGIWSFLKGRTHRKH